MLKREPHSELEKELFNNVFEKTPDYIKNLNLFDFDNENEFSFILKKEHLYPHSDENPEGLNLKEWFEGYAKEASQIGRVFLPFVVSVFTPCAAWILAIASKYNSELYLTSEPAIFLISLP